MKSGNIDLRWTGHAGFIISAGKVLYVDPYQLSENSTKDVADILLITHEHYDHCSIADIEKICSKETIILTIADCQSKLISVRDKVKDIKLVSPGDKHSIEGIEIEVVPAYNVDKRFHQKEDEKVGFIISIAGKKIYHAGDTDLIPEMNTFDDIGIALLPISGEVVMDAEEAAQAANIIQAEISIPMHYGSDVGGTISDAESFKVECKTLGLEVEILEKE